MEIGWSKVSTNADIFSVGPLQPEMIGLPTSVGLLQPISIPQASYLKDTTHFINVIEKTKVSKKTILVVRV